VYLDEGTRVLCIFESEMHICSASWNAKGNDTRGGRLKQPARIDPLKPSVCRSVEVILHTLDGAGVEQGLAKVVGLQLHAVLQGHVMALVESLCVLR
jgi:hypothetical protein